MATPQSQTRVAVYSRGYYRRNSAVISARKRPKARAYKQRVLLLQAIEAARRELTNANLKGLI